MTAKKGIEQGLHVAIYNLVRCGYDIHEAANKMGLRFDLAHRLFNHEFEIRRMQYVSVLPKANEKNFSYSEMQMRGESYKSLYLDYEPEQITITKKSKV